MCGITGIISLNNAPIEKEQLVGMTNALIHRGPDAEGFWFNAKSTLGFGHRRLSIIDLSDDGRQPFLYQDKYVVVFNGEIYNYLEIREELIKAGYQFTTKTDTEVLAALFDHKGEKMFEDIDGMFAFVIYDLKTHKIFGARDRFGEKPLYYTVKNNRLYFASEIKAFWAAGLKKKPDNTRLYYYLKQNVCEFPEHNETTFFEDVFQILPSHSFTIQENKFATKKYWDLDSIKINKSITVSEAVQQLNFLFSRSVTNRLRADVPVGSSLSGGIDSSIVVKQIEALKSKDQVQKTFSARFQNFAKDEGKYIEILLSACKNVDSYSTWPGPEDFLNEIDKIAYHQDEPFGSASIVAQWNVMRLVKQNNVTVLLDGQGADEIFAGYLSFINPYMNELYKDNNSEYQQQKKFLKEELNYSHEISDRAKLLLRHGYLFKAVKPFTSLLKGKRKSELDTSGFTRDFSEKLLPDDFSRELKNDDNLNTALLKTIWHDGLPTLMRYADRNSMAHSVEVRLPYLDHRLAEFAFSLPQVYKINRGFTKYILRKSFEDRVPREIIWRKDKIGYEAPQTEWLKMAEKKIRAAEDKLKDHKIVSDTSTFSSWNILMSSYLF